MNFPADFAVSRINLVHPLLSSCLFYGKTTMEAWAMEEFAGAALGDERLNQRLVKLAMRFADKPTARIPGACWDWSETQAAYRFFEQSSDQKWALGWQDILTPHVERTEARMRQHPVVLCLQDTTELDFNGQEMAGLGPLSYEAQRGMHLHPTYVVTDRCLPDGGKLWASVLAGTPLGEIEFTMASRQGQAAREVRQQLWASQISLPDGRGGQLSVTCLIAREANAPAGSKPVEWRLLTNRGAESLETVVELIDWYRCRWEIETFFHVLKNGCQVEALQLGSIAMLGGFLGKKCDGEPGVKTLWLGMQRLRDFVDGMEHMQAIYNAK